MIGGESPLWMVSGELQGLTFESLPVFAAVEIYQGPVVELFELRHQIPIGSVLPLRFGLGCFGDDHLPLNDVQEIAVAH